MQATTPAIPLELKSLFDVCDLGDDHSVDEFLLLCQDNDDQEQSRESSYPPVKTEGLDVDNVFYQQQQQQQLCMESIRQPSNQPQDHPTLVAQPTATSNTEDLRDLNVLKAYFHTIINQLVQENASLREQNVAQQQLINDLTMRIQSSPSSPEMEHHTEYHQHCLENNSSPSHPSNDDPFDDSGCKRSRKRRRSNVMIEVENSHAKTSHNYDKFVHKFTFK